MDFHALLAKMKEIDSAPVQSAPAAEACGDPMSMPAPAMPAPAMPQQAPPAHPSMSVNLNAQGMDSIEQMMKLFQKVNPDMMPKIAPPPMVTTMPSIAAIKPEIPPMKMLPDFDAHNNDKVGGEMDIDKPGMMDFDKDMGSQPGELGASLDRDGDGDHDMDDHDMEKDLGDKESDMDIDSDDSKKEDGGFQGSTTEPEEKYNSVDYMNNRLAGGMNRPKNTFPKVSDGDNPMQKVREGEDSYRASIRAELQRRLNEAKGAK